MNYNSIEAETFLDRLRNITSQSHKSLEELPVSLSIVNPAVTQEEYAHYLWLMHDVVKDAETNIFPALTGIIPDLKERSKFRHLEDDLKILRESKSTYDTPLSNEEKFSIPFALGIMYVIEGSTLGGRFILKNITEALGYDAQQGAKYFAGYGNATGSRWKNFLNHMVQYQEQQECEDEIIAGANFAFTRINEHFTQNTPQ